MLKNLMDLCALAVEDEQICRSVIDTDTDGAEIKAFQPARSKIGRRPDPRYSPNSSGHRSDVESRRFVPTESAASGAEKRTRLDRAGCIRDAARGVGVVPGIAFGRSHRVLGPLRRRGREGAEPRRRTKGTEEESRRDDASDWRSPKKTPREEHMDPTKGLCPRRCVTFAC
ncbi:hypothetical protein KM043_009854 [Ampulex compressa]|nr:hypothetical protein KM043_009854 [Ampulex compressa]